MKATVLGFLAGLAFAAGQVLADGLNTPGVPVIGRPITLTVCSSGCQFPSLHAAVNSLNGFAFPFGGAVVTLAVSGHLSGATSIFGKTNSNVIGIAGTAPVMSNLLSIVSSSGSAGNRSIVLQLDNASGITSGDIETITNASGGTNPTRLNGPLKVTSVNSGSNQITVTSLNRAAAAPSGSVTGTLNDLSAVVTCTNADCLDIWNGAAAANVDYVAFVGDGTAHQGISVQDVGRLYIPHLIAVYGFGGVQVFGLYNSQINGGTIAAAGGGTVFGVKQTSALDVVGVATGASATGFSASSNSSINLQSGSGASGNGTEGVQSDGASYVSATAAYSNDNGDYGYYASRWGYIDQGTASGNATGTAYYGSEQVAELQIGQDTNAYIHRSAAADASGDLVIQTFAGNAIDLLDTGGVEVGSPTGGAKGSHTVNLSGTVYMNGNQVITPSQYFYVGTDGNAEIYRASNALELQTFGGYPVILAAAGGVEVGAPTGANEGSGTVNVAGVYYANGTAGVSCSGAPTAGFASANGIVVHC